jgi:transposase
MGNVPQEGQKQSPDIKRALQVIFDEHGLSPTEVARHLKVHRQTIYDWRSKGTEPSYSLGVKLIALGDRLQRGETL